jgi:DNA sulfur modification protein DndD
LTDPERTRIIERLERLERLSMAELRQLLAEYEEATEQIDKLTREIAQLSGVEDRIREVTDELERLNQLDRDLNQQIGALQRQDEADSALLSQKRAEAARYVERNQSARPQLARADKAEVVARLIAEAIEDLYPKYVERLSTEMTAIYKHLAHKQLVKKIEISPDCTVRLLGSGGRDVRSMDASAGEDQIFALSLVAAIARVSGKGAPFVIDTPLARLDTEHRINVLQYFAQRGGEQVVLLSQPDEVHGPYYRAICERVGKAFRIDFEELGDGVGKAHVREGYFPARRADRDGRSRDELAQSRLCQLPYLTPGGYGE